MLALLQLLGAVAVGEWGIAAFAGGMIAVLVAATAGFVLPDTRRVLQAGEVGGGMSLDVTPALDEAGHG